MSIPLTGPNGEPIEAVAIAKGDGTTNPPIVAVSGTIPVTPPTASTATKTNVAGSAASVQLLAANANRLSGVIVNDSTAICYVLFGAGAASTTNYTYQMAGSTALGVAMLELLPNWVGRVAAIWASATGTARITENTA